MTLARIGRTQYKRTINCRHVYPNPVELLPSLVKPCGSGPILGNLVEYCPTIHSPVGVFPVAPYHVESCRCSQRPAKSRRILVNIPISCRPLLSPVGSSQTRSRPVKSRQILSHMAYSFSNPAQPGQLCPNLAISCHILSTSAISCRKHVKFRKILPDIAGSSHILPNLANISRPRRILPGLGKHRPILPNMAQCGEI